VYYGHRDFGTTSESASPDPTDDHGFPWEFRPGTELVERWSLPDAAGNPEFGLPRLPERDSARAVGRISVIGGDEATIDSSSNRPKQLSPRSLEDCGNGRDSR
jgi:hypothetical protein